MFAELLLAAALTAAPAASQVPTADPNQRVAWDYRVTDLTTYAIDRFEVSWDSNTFESVGIPEDNFAAETSGFRTYRIPFPALTPGEHTVSVRACNVDVCSAAIGPLTFRLVVVPPPATNLRIVSGGEGSDPLPFP